VGENEGGADPGPHQVGGEWPSEGDPWTQALRQRQGQTRPPGKGDGGRSPLGDESRDERPPKAGARSRTPACAL